MRPHRLSSLPIVTGAEKSPMTKPGLRYRAERLAGLGVGLLGLALVPAITFMVVATQGPAAADQISDLKAQATHIARSLVLEQLQIDTDRQQYEVDTAKLQRDQAQIVSMQAQIQADSARVTRDHTRLRTEAVSAYINLDPQASSNAGMFDNQQSALPKKVYQEVIEGDIALAIDDLHTDETGLRAERVTLGEQEVRDHATTAQEAAAADAASRVASQLASEQSLITGKLAVAVTEQQAAQSAAAAAAVRAAQAKAAAAAATATASNSGGDPSLPPFLQCVLQAESGGNYQAVSPDGTYMGGFQFSQPTWNSSAQLAGMPQLVGVPPNVATPAEQDDVAIALYNAYGGQAWNDSCRSS